MKPRLKTSKKWSSLPPELTEQIRSVFRDSFAKHLGPAKVIVEGRIYPEEIMLRVGFIEPNRLKQENFEVSMDLDLQTKKSSVLGKVHACVDAIASVMHEYFENKGKEESELDLPYEWRSYEFNKAEIYLCYSTINTELEAAADALLGEAAGTDDVLVHVEEEDDELPVDDSGDDGGGDEGDDGGGKHRHH